MKKRLRQLSIFLIVFALCGEVLGATGKVCGRVFEHGTNKPLAFAKVIVVGTNLSAMTNTEGRYTIFDTPAGSFSVHAFLVGYKTAIAQEVIMAENRVTELYFGLDESNSSVRRALASKLSNSCSLGKDFWDLRFGISSLCGLGGEIEFDWRALGDLNLWRERKALTTQDLLSHPLRRRMRLK